MSTRLKLLLEQRKNLVEQMRGHLEKYETVTSNEDGSETRTMGGEEALAQDKYGADLAELDKVINRHRSVADAEDRNNELGEQFGNGPTGEPTGDLVPGGGGQEDRARTFIDSIVAVAEGRSKSLFLPFNSDSVATGEIRSNLARYEKRMQTIGIAPNAATPAAGGELVPEEFMAELIKHMVEFSPIRRLARVIGTSHGRVMTWPRVTGRPVSAQVNEATNGNATFTKSDASFDQIQISAWKFGHITELSSELLNDNVISAMSIVAELGAEALTMATDPLYTAGDGNNKPSGIVPGATPGVTLSGANPTFDDLIKLEHALFKPYRANGKYLVSDDSVLALRLLKDADNRYMWVDSVREGDPTRLHGKQVESDHNMPAGAGERVVLFGDFAKAFLIRDAEGIEIVQSDDYGFDRDVSAIRFKLRTDSKVINAQAVVAGTAA